MVTIPHRRNPWCGIGSFHFWVKGGRYHGVPSYRRCLRQDLTKALVNLHMPSYSRGPKVVERILGRLQQGRWFDVVRVPCRKSKKCIVFCFPSTSLSLDDSCCPQSSGSQAQGLPRNGCHSGHNWVKNQPCCKIA